MSNRNTFLVNVILNGIATMIPVFVLQVILYPRIDGVLGETGFGKMITITGIITVISGTLGGALNRIRVIYNAEYIKENIEGDFNIILILEMVFGGLSFIVGYRIIVGDSGWVTLGFGVIISALWCLWAYLMAFFRIMLNYAQILVNNACLSIGYLAGHILFLKTGYWEMVFITGYSVALIHAFVFSDIVREGIKVTKLFRRTFRETSLLIMASLVSATVTYADRFIVYPVMGGFFVTVYYVGSIIGKVVGLAAEPVGHVVLSYIARIDCISKTVVKRYIFWISVIGMGGYMLCLIAGRPIIRYLYPSYYDEAMSVFPLTSAGAIILVLIGLLNPFILKYHEKKVFFIINLMALALYTSMGLALSDLYGLRGFCIGGLISNFLQYLALIFVCLNTKGKSITKEGR